MRCPHCGQTIGAPLGHCPVCLTVFGEGVQRQLSIYFELKKQVDYLRNLQGYYGKSLEQATHQLELFQAMVEEGLRPAAAEAVRAPAGEAATPPPATEKVEVSAEIREQTAPLAEKAAEPTLGRPAAGEGLQFGGYAKSGPGKKPSGAERDRSLEVKLGQKWVLALGILAIIFAVGYFLKYSFDQGWIGPAGRVTLAYLFGLGLMFGGDRFRHRGLIGFGLAQVAGGSVVLYFSCFAAFQLYDLFSQTLAFALMVLVTILTATLAVVYDSRWMAVLGLVGGFLTPIMLSTGHDNMIALLSYMLMLNLALLAVALYKQWQIIITLGFVATYILFGGWYAAHYNAGKFWPALLFLNAFYLVYTLMPFAALLKGRTGAGQAPGMIVIVLNAFLAFGYSYAMIDQLYTLPSVAIIAVLYAAVYLGLSTLAARRQLGQGGAMVVLMTQSALFLVITVPLVVSANWITVFWMLQALAIFVAGVRLQRDLLKAGALVLVLLGAGKFLLYDYFWVFNLKIDSLTFGKGYTHDLASRLLTAVVVLAVIWAIQHWARRTAALAEPIRWLVAFTWAGLLFIVLNIETAGFFADYLPAARFAAASVLWTLFSVGLMLWGFRRHSGTLRGISLGLFVITIFKVFLVDMAEVSTPYRIISFFVLGCVLVGVSWLYYRFKDRLAGAMTDVEPPKEVE